MRSPSALLLLGAIATWNSPPQAAIPDPVTDASGYSHSGNHTYSVGETSSWN